MEHSPFHSTARNYGITLNSIMKDILVLAFIWIVFGIGYVLWLLTAITIVENIFRIAWMIRKRKRQLEEHE